MKPDFTRCLPIALLLACLPAGLVQAQSLKGSRAVMERQNQIAISYNYSFLKTSREVRSFHTNGYLVEVTDSDTLEIHNVSYPYARPEVKLFLERLSAQYRNACGEKLTVTSLTRPLDNQPRNASEVSVHPTGMAIDLRIPGKSRCRSWLESTLLSLEGSDVLDVTRERYPPHFHVALFTKSYANYVAALETERRDASPRSAYDYMVQRGDSLYLIAQRNDTTIDDLRKANNLRSNVLQIGQVLKIPGDAEAPLQAAGPASVQVAAAETPATSPAADQRDSGDTAGNEQQSARSYKVRRGDSLYLIAQRNNTTIDALRIVNGLDSDLLQVGQELRIPGSGDMLAAADQQLLHRVRRGDTLWRIASRYKVSINRIRSVNDLSGDFLEVGQILTIYGN